MKSAGVTANAPVSLTRPTLQPTPVATSSTTPTTPLKPFKLYRDRPFLKALHDIKRHIIVSSLWNRYTVAQKRNIMKLYVGRPGILPSDTNEQQMNGLLHYQLPCPIVPLDPYIVEYNSETRSDLTHLTTAHTILSYPRCTDASSHDDSRPTCLVIGSMGMMNVSVLPISSVGGGRDRNVSMDNNAFQVVPVTTNPTHRISAFPPNKTEAAREFEQECERLANNGRLRGARSDRAESWATEAGWNRRRFVPPPWADNSKNKDDINRRLDEEFYSTPSDISSRSTLTKAGLTTVPLSVDIVEMMRVEQMKTIRHQVEHVLPNRGFLQIPYSASHWHEEKTRLIPEETKQLFKLGYDLQNATDHCFRWTSHGNLDMTYVDNSTRLKSVNFCTSAVVGYGKTVAMPISGTCVRSFLWYPDDEDVLLILLCVQPYGTGFQFYY